MLSSDMTLANQRGDNTIEPQELKKDVKLEMLSMKKIRLLTIVLLVLFLMSSNQFVTAADTGTIIDIDLDQSKKEFSMFGITGIQITLKVEVEFIVQVNDAIPNVYFEATVRKSGTSVELSESGHQAKIVSNNTKSTIAFEMMPILMSASGKAGPDGEISLKKGNKMIFDLKMSYYAPGEVIKTALDNQEEIFYLLASPPTNLVIIAVLGGGAILIAIVILFLIYRSKHSKRSENLSWPF